MKPAWQLIVSPFAFGILGFMIAYSVARLVPTPPSRAPVLEVFLFVGLPLICSILGWIFAYLATPARPK